MPIHLPFHVPRIPDFLKRPLDPTQTLEAFEHYAEKAIDFATRHGGEIGRNIMDDLVDAAKPYAAALDIGVDALLPGINLFYGEKWASRQGRKNPFKQNGGVVRPKSSQSPAQRMSGRKRPRDPKTYAYERDIRQRLADFERHKAAGRMAGRTIAVAKRSYKQRKSRKPIKPGMMTKRHYDDHGTITRAHTLWMGVEDSGSYDRMFDILGEAVTRAILAKAKIYPTLYDQQLSDFMTSAGALGCVLTLGFKTINTSGTDFLVNETVSGVNSLTFKTLSAAVTNLIKIKAHEINAVNGQVSYYLDSFILSNSQDGDRLAYDLNMGESIINIMCKSKVKFQNITSNSTGGDDLDVIGTNPINGKRYTFDDARARLVTQLHEANSAYHKFEGMKPPYGIVALDALGVDDPLAHPPAAKNAFVNCTGVAPVYIKAGGMSHHYQTFSVKRTMRQFIEDIAKKDFGFTRSKFGKITWWCFERTYKQNGTGAAADDISIGFNRELSMYAMCKLKQNKAMLKHYDNQDIGLL